MRGCSSAAVLGPSFSCTGGAGQSVGGGMLQQPLRIPVTGTTPWASSFADKLVRGIMGAYAGPGSSTLDKRAASSRALEGSSGPERPVLWAVV